ncbi:MAG: molybdopterin-guanine dinucleotide biosynthesis protein B [Mogibacterium sp.]|nr:molybdopterin-guanine dinucleotide biosynthesis protein B [Mogibacterium sp.]
MQTVIAVSGIKNSGKTTLISRLVAEFSGRGKKVAVIKHDGHDFECDVPGTDTRKFADHGAYGTACFSGNRMFVHRIGTGESYQDLIRFFPEADIIFIEGAKDSALDKIEVVRSGISAEPASNPEGRFLIATDLPQGTFDEETADINDIAGIVKKIEEIVDCTGCR